MDIIIVSQADETRFIDFTTVPNRIGRIDVDEFDRLLENISPIGRMAAVYNAVGSGLVSGLKYFHLASQHEKSILERNNRYERAVDIISGGKGENNVFRWEDFDRIADAAAGIGAFTLAAQIRETIFHDYKAAAELYETDSMFSQAGDLRLKLGDRYSAAFDYERAAQFREAHKASSGMTSWAFPAS